MRLVTCAWSKYEFHLKVPLNPEIAQSLAGLVTKDTKQSCPASEV